MGKEVEPVVDDELFTPAIRRWTLEKYRLVWFYDDIFSSGMKRNTRIYIDLFAGAGYGRLEETGEVYPSSAILALRIPHPFTGYVFCEKDPRCLEALKSRVERDHPEAAAEFICGDSNENVSEIIAAVGRLTAERRFLTFCYADPCGAHLRFSTIRGLARALRRVDYLVLLALWMDIRRNEAIYTDPGSGTIASLLERDDWRDDWRSAKSEGMKFARFVAEQFAARVLSLGYLKAPKSQWKEISASVDGLPLYHLLFFSKHELGYKFWKDVLKYGSIQGDLGLHIP